MRATYLWAVAIAVLLVSWLASGQLDQEAVEYESSIAERNAQSLTLMSDQRHQFELYLHKRNCRRATRTFAARPNKRTVEVRTEITGRVVERPLSEDSLWLRISCSADCQSKTGKRRSLNHSNA